MRKPYREMTEWEKGRERARARANYERFKVLREKARATGRVLRWR